MKKILLISLIASVQIFATQPDEQESGQGLSQEQMNQIRAIIKQTQQLANENMQSNGENIFNNQTQNNINSYTDSNVKIKPFDVFRPTLQNEASQESQQNYQDLHQEPQQLSKEELELMKNSMRNQNLKALQHSFMSKKYKGFENTKEYIFTKNKTIKLRTRYAMATTLIFDSEIESFILGDSNGFNIQEIPNKANIVTIKPNLIGIDTSLTIFTGDGNTHNFYIYSTDHKNNQHPDLIVYIKDPKQKEINKEIKAKQEMEYLTIKDGIAEIKVPKKEIYKGYIQKAKKENEWLLSSEIFSDNKFTYFKYEKDKMPQVPAVFAVIDKQDSPVETRVIGDYVIAETTNPKFTIKSGNSYICIDRLQTEEEKQDLQAKKKLNQKGEK